MAQLVTLVCDSTYRGKRCEEPPSHWVIVAEDGTTTEVDLCDRHATPLRELLALGRPVEAPQQPVRRRSRIREVTLRGDPL